MNLILSTSILLLFLTFCSGISNIVPTIKFRIKSLKCEHNATFYNGSTNCFIKPTRDGFGITTIQYNFRKPCNDLWLHLYIMYKFTGQYRQWMFSGDESICNIEDGSTPPGIFFKYVFAAVHYVTPKTLHKCPFVGVEGVTAVNIDKIVSNTIPQVVPRGDYRIILRFHTKTNETFFVVTIGGVIDAIRAIDNVSMG